MLCHWSNWTLFCITSAQQLSRLLVHHLQGLLHLLIEDLRCQDKVVSIFLSLRIACLMYKIILQCIKSPIVFLQYLIFLHQFHFWFKNWFLVRKFKYYEHWEYVKKCIKCFLVVLHLFSSFSFLRFWSFSHRTLLDIIRGNFILVLVGMYACVTFLLSEIYLVKYL